MKMSYLPEGSSQQQILSLSECSFRMADKHSCDFSPLRIVSLPFGPTSLLSIVASARLYTSGRQQSTLSPSLTCWKAHSVASLSLFHLPMFSRDTLHLQLYKFRHPGIIISSQVLKYITLLTQSWLWKSGLRFRHSYWVIDFQILSMSYVLALMASLQLKLRFLYSFTDNLKLVKSNAYISVKIFSLTITPMTIAMMIAPTNNTLTFGWPRNYCDRFAPKAAWSSSTSTSTSYSSKLLS